MYVGQTVHFGKRMTEHRKSLRGKRHHCTPLQRAWDKHGEAAFTFKLVIKCDTELSAREQFVLDAFRKIQRQYNVGECADPPMRGRKRPDTQVRMSVPGATDAMRAGHKAWLNSEASAEFKCKAGTIIKIAREKARNDPVIEAKRKANQALAASSQEYREKQRVILKYRLDAGWKPTEKLKKRVVCTATGEVWGSVKECAASIGVSPCTVTSWLKGYKKSKTGKEFSYA